jgi:hypothetical protein
LVTFLEMLGSMGYLRRPVFERFFKYGGNFCIRGNSKMFFFSS